MRAMTTSMPKNRWRRYIFWGALSFILGAGGAAVWALRHFTSDTFVREQVLRAAREALNADVDIEQASLAIFRGVELRGLRIASLPTLSGPGTPIITARHVRCDINPWSYVSGRFELRRLVLTDPIVHVFCDTDGSINLAALPRPKEGKREEARISLFPEGIWLLAATITYTDSRLLKDDRPRVLRGVNLVVRPHVDDFSHFEFTGSIGEPPLRGARFQGFYRERLGRAAPNFLLSFHMPAYELGPAAHEILPADISQLLNTLESSGSAWGDIQLSVRPDGRLDFAGNLAMAGVSLRPPWLPLEVENLATSLRFDNCRVQSGPCAARINGGNGHGAFIIDISEGEGGVPSFRVTLTVQRASLSLMGQRLGRGLENVRGSLDAEVELEGVFGRPDSISGTISCEVSNAFLGELPIFLGVLNILNLELPQRPVFDRGRVRADIADGVLHLREVWLSSPTLDLTARGTIDFAGDTDLLVVMATNQRPGSGWFLPLDLLKKVVQAVVGGLEQMLLPPVRVTGSLARPKMEVLYWEPFKRPLRAITDVFYLLPPLRSAPENVP